MSIGRTFHLPNLTFRISAAGRHGFRLCLLSFVFSTFFCCSLRAEKRIVVHNLRARTDSSGAIIDAHDGQIVRFGKTYYWFGTSYGETAGFQQKAGFVCYVSDDLQQWKKKPVLLENAPLGHYYKLRVVYNSETGQYVLWYRWKTEASPNQFGVAVSEQPEGPYRIADSQVKLYYDRDGLDNFNLFTDQDGTCYMLYNTLSGGGLSVERLSDDYLSSTMENGGYQAEGLEAGILFRRRDKYYILAGEPCRFCNSGTGCRVLMSEHPLDGYQPANDINRYPGTPEPRLVDGILNPNLHVVLPKKSDGTFPSIEVDLPGDTLISSLKVVQYTGGRDGSGCDTTGSIPYDFYRLPTLECRVEKEGQWMPLPVKSTAMTSSVYTVITLAFDPVRTDRLRVGFGKKYPCNLRINQLELYGGGRLVSASSLVFLVGAERSALPIIPGQASSLLEVPSPDGMQYIWMADLWGSTSDRFRGHDYVYWSPPLIFSPSGEIEALRWTDRWDLLLP